MLIDFNGDGRSDVFWNRAKAPNPEFQDTNVWFGQNSGRFDDTYAGSRPADGQGWTIEAVGDFNGDSRADVLWRAAGSGELVVWQGRYDLFYDSFSIHGIAGHPAVDLSWSVQATGDFNGDGQMDLVWRHTSGEITQWLGAANSQGGGSANLSDNFQIGGAKVDNSWHIVTSGDFNGDGFDDLIWRHTSGEITQWLGSSTGGFSDNYANAGAKVDNSWKIAASGDFNGDGFDDLIWRHTGGEITEWLGGAGGKFVDNYAKAKANVDNSWTIIASGDFDGDFRSDLLWRHSSGEVTEWLGTFNGLFFDNYVFAHQNISTAWSVPSDGIWIG